MNHRCNSLEGLWQCLIAGESKPAWNASSEQSALTELSRPRLSQRERWKQKQSNGRNKRYSSAPLKPLSYCDARRDSSADWVRRAFKAPDNATQHQSAAITALQEPLPRRVHVPLCTVKKQQSFKGSAARTMEGWHKRPHQNLRRWSNTVETRLRYLEWIHMFHTNKSQGGTKQGNVIRYRNKRPALGAFLGKITLVLVSFCTS